MAYCTRGIAHILIGNPIMIDDGSVTDKTALPDYRDDGTPSAMERAEIEDYITHLLVDEEKEVPKYPHVYPLFWR